MISILEHRPHGLYLFNYEHIDWFMQKVTKKWIKEQPIGHVVLWMKLYTQDSYPTDEGYIYKHPENIELFKLIARHELGLKVIGYFHGPKWERKHLNPVQALRNIKDLDLDGVLLDNGHIHNDKGVVEWFFSTLRYKNYYIIHHCSVEPFYGYEQVRGPWAIYEDIWYKGETNPLPSSINDPLWDHYLNSGTGIPSYKSRMGSESVNWRTANPWWVEKLASAGGTYRVPATPNRLEVDEWERFKVAWKDYCVKNRGYTEVS